MSVPSESERDIYIYRERKREREGEREGEWGGERELHLNGTTKSLQSSPSATTRRVEGLGNSAYFGYLSFGYSFRRNLWLDIYRDVEMSWGGGRPELCSGSEAGSNLRLTDSCITQVKVQGPSSICNESKEAEEVSGVRFKHAGSGMGAERVQVQGLSLS